MNLSFAGCGFLGIYHVGVACCFREYAPNVVLPTPDNEVVMSGASAGALTAAGIICNCDLGQATTDTLRVAQKARSRALGPFHPSFKITRILQDGLLYILPDNAHEICDRRLHISLTRVSDGKNVVVNRFSSKDELIQALICSSFVPVWSGFVPPKYRGVRYIDGGLSNNIPIVNEHTVTVCPLAGETDICPDDMSSSFLHLNFAQTSVQMTTENVYRLTRAFFPPHPEVLSAWCKQGFEDALHFLQKTNVISCTRCLTLRTVIPVFRDTTTIRRSSSQTTNHAGSHAAEHSAPVAPSHPPDNCEDCRNFKRHISQTSKGLPTHVSSALQEGIDSQKGLMAYIFRFKAAKALSIMSIPMLLPIDLAYSITWRLVEYAPHLKSDFTWFVGQLASLLLKLMSRINKGRHSYSARLTCQFALTEFHQDDTEESAEHHVARDDQQSRNFGFSIDMEADAMRSAGRIFRNLSQKELTLEASSIVQAAVKVEEEAIAQQRRLAQHDPMVDTYDNYVEVTQTHDAIMAYYYLDDKRHIKVMEIFDVSDVQLDVADLPAAAPAETVVSFDVGDAPARPRSRGASLSIDGATAGKGSRGTSFSIDVGEGYDASTLAQELLQHGCHRCCSRKNSVSGRSARSDSMSGRSARSDSMSGRSTRSDSHGSRPMSRPSSANPL